ARPLASSGARTLSASGRNAGQPQRRNLLALRADCPDEAEPRQDEGEAEGGGLLGLIITEGRSIRIPQIAAHPASYGFPPHHPPMTSLLGVPVTVRNRPIGNLYLTDKEGAREFSEEDERLAGLFALHAGIAIENARLHEAVQALAVVEERDRIGKDLHDGIIQNIYGVTLSLEDVEDLATEDPAEATARVDRAIDALHGTIRDLRNFIFGLHPELVDGTDLVGLLAALAEQVRQNSLIDVEVRLPESPIDLPAHARAELLQIAREALSNVARHSGGTWAEVGISADGDQIVLAIADNGRGFEPTTAATGEHYGLANMRDRAVALGGGLQVDTAVGAGTRIIVRVPATGYSIAGDPPAPLDLEK
ncbi:MAG: GAF domain-containing sensor histidine kinase, partial [Chloroflexota bacterium]